VHFFIELKYVYPFGILNKEVGSHVTLLLRAVDLTCTIRPRLGVLSPLQPLVSVGVALLPLPL
jgi:hypothetical protein